MATQVTHTFVDDIDGSTDGVEQYTFSWLGQEYEIDLAPRSAKKLVEVMDLYLAKATRVTKSRAADGGRGRGSATSKTPGAQAGAIRVWAREQGMEVSERGRVNQAVKDAYAQAHAAD